MLTTTVAGRTWNFSHAIGRNAAAGNGFSQPQSVATAPGGVLYVVSRGNEYALGGVSADNKRISKLTIDQEFIGELGKRDYVWPAGVALTSDETVYSGDEHENFIAYYSSDGERLGKWGEYGSGEGQLNGPSGLAFDKEDNLYVVDARNDRVEKFTRDGQFLSAWGGPGEGEGQFNRPWGITLDKNGDVYVVDWGNNRVQKFSPDGTFLMRIGSKNGDGGELNHPADVAVDSEGDIYVTDWGNKRVQIYDPEGNVITSLVGDAHEFSNWAKTANESNPDVIKAYRRVKDTTPMARFQRPTGIAVDDQDRIVITETTRGRLQVYAKEKDYMDPQFNL